MLCTNCFNNIEKGEIKCSTCGKPLHKECGVSKGKEVYCDACSLSTKNITEHLTAIPDVIRRSHIETYRSCPYKFYMEVIKGMEQGDTIYTKMGTDLHTCFEKGSLDSKYDKKDMTDDFLNFFGAYQENMFDSKEQRDKMFKRGLDCIDNFYNTLPNVAKTLTTEENIITEIGTGLPKLSVTIDHIGEEGNEIILGDWKTGAVMVGNKISSDLQAPLYIYSAREKYQRPIKRFAFYYLNENKQRVFERVDHDNYTCCVNRREYKINITDVIKDVQRLFSHILANEFNVPKDSKGMYFACKMCHIKKLGACQGADMEAWKQYNKKG